MGKIKTLRSTIRPLDQRSAPPAKKTADAELLTAQHRAWRSAVLKRAGWRCEVIVQGVRCPNHHPTHVMYADHRVERKDDGARYDIANGMCMCAMHHTLKTNAERNRRLAAPL